METKVIKVNCNICKKPKEVKVPTKGYEAWKQGAHIQRAMPFVSADDRELLMSGVCGPCFDKAFAEPEEV